MNKNQSFEERKEALLLEAKSVGIDDVTTGSANGVTLNTLDLAIKLTREHRAEIYEKLEKRRNAQK
jgi:hypothetical protein